jgi:hypothetical protein
MEAKFYVDTPDWGLDCDTGVMADLEAGWPLLKSSSLVIGHDYSYDWPGDN